MRRVIRTVSVFHNRLKMKTFHLKCTEPLLTCNDGLANLPATRMTFIARTLRNNSDLSGLRPVKKSRLTLVRSRSERLFFLEFAMPGTIEFQIEGVSPLLMHNGQLANPLNPLVKQMKALTGQRKKTDEVHIELSRLEFRAGLYLNSSGQVEVPAELLESCIIEGAKKSKLGKQFKSAICIMDNSPLDYGEKLTVDQLWGRAEEFADVRGVKVGTSRVMRTRPIFRTWRLKFEVSFNGELVNPEQIELAVADAGAQVGIGDYRPKFGRFQIVG